MSDTASCRRPSPYNRESQVQKGQCEPEIIRGKTEGAFGLGTQFWCASRGMNGAFCTFLFVFFLRLIHVAIEDTHVRMGCNTRHR
ncbi:predicted protein [Histoplasma mississippiense (nom. inval.)]|uniref:predicted protein n=1 Tax=Ajellomyces capsulatus (strain NAm1 / WU24) TaxID=2059318 RepID=UPI000157D1EE|nr:predicted protein [Histoplasma mississippiense (nom. inval.)]EDN04354.1 predicted protein [Histoplasma mississippiense (nom. inval.)]